jgi:hypothetical protein
VRGVDPICTPTALEVTGIPRAGTARGQWQVFGLAGAPACRHLLAVASQAEKAQCT